MEPRHFLQPSQPRFRDARTSAPRRMPPGRSRRQFLRTATGAAALGAAAGAGLLRPGAARAVGGLGLAVPIPATLNFFGQDFHVQAPPLTGPDSDPATVFNFEGASGIAFISGSCVRRDRKTGESLTLPYAFNDMRFMQGRFRGRDGHARDGTFALI